MNIFVDKKELVEIIVYVWGDPKIEASHLESEAPKDSQKVSFFCQKPNHADSVKIMKLAKLGQGEADPIVFQDSIVRTLVKSVNDGEESRVLSQSQIDEINPSITRAVATGLLELVSI